MVVQAATKGDGKGSWCAGGWVAIRLGVRHGVDGPLIAAAADTASEEVSCICPSGRRGLSDPPRSACAWMNQHLYAGLGRAVRVPLGESKFSAPRHPGRAGKAAKQAAQHERANTSRLSEAGTTHRLYLLATPLLFPRPSPTTATMNVIKLQKYVLQCAPPCSISVGALPPCRPPC